MLRQDFTTPSRSVVCETLSKVIPVTFATTFFPQRLEFESTCDTDIRSAKSFGIVLRHFCHPQSTTIRPLQILLLVVLIYLRYLEI
jgi:hypothetical protein